MSFIYISNKPVATDRVGGWITMSNITAPVDASKRSLVVICHGLNMQLTENVVSTHTVNILRKYHSRPHESAAPSVSKAAIGGLLWFMFSFHDVCT